MTTFVDTSAFFAALDASDSEHERAQSILAGPEEWITSDHVLVELWRLLSLILDERRADLGIRRLLESLAHVEPVGMADVQTALDIGADFPDQDFSLVDRTSFAVMRRLGVSTVATFDHHFAVYRFGPGKRRAFEIAR